MKPRPVETPWGAELRFRAPSDLMAILVLLAESRKTTDDGGI